MALEEATGALPTGASTMSPAMASMQAYPRYLYRKIRPSLGRRVWEIGIGHGTYTRWLRDDGASVLATDIDADCLAAVATRFVGDANVTTARIDLTDEQSVRALRDFGADSLVCLNVLEHIRDDVAALRWLRESVAPGARMGIVVPAHPKLFGRMDAEAGHFRRYTRASLRSAFERAGWHIERVAYFNLLGALGWWYHNRWRKDAGLEDAAVNHQMSAADRLLPRFAFVTDPLFGRLAGLSVLGIATNSSAGSS
ncbi:MAG: class I SAM-dependent methyltransferase [Planctomycetes bacterium]|nr:class I SAM-dependent methyltransferase [Planctomycetota bacterium]